MNSEIKNENNSQNITKKLRGAKLRDCHLYILMHLGRSAVPNSLLHDEKLVDVTTFSGRHFHTFYYVISRLKLGCLSIA